MSRFPGCMGLTSCGFAAISCENTLMRIRGTNPLAVVSVLAIVLGCAGCGGGASGVALPSGGGSGSGSGSNNQSACNVMGTGQGTSLNGFRPFASDSPWNTDISGSPVDSNSDAIIRFIGPHIGLHPDFGLGQYQGSNI